MRQRPSWTGKRRGYQRAQVERARPSVLLGRSSGPEHRFWYPGRRQTRPPHAPRRASSTAPLPVCILSAQVSVPPQVLRSEEHTSELQSLMRISYAVFCLKKKKNKKDEHKRKSNETQIQK